MNSARKIETTTKSAILPASDSLLIRAKKLRVLAVHGLRDMYRPEEKLFVFRLKKSAEGIVGEGLSPRYTAIALIGLAEESASLKDSVLSGDSINDVCDRLKDHALKSKNLGDVSLILWAAKSIGYTDRDSILKRLISLRPAVLAHPTVECAWALTALCMDNEAQVRSLRKQLADRLMNAFHDDSGMFPHHLERGDDDSLRSHVCCFADLVYPIQALSHYFSFSGDFSSLNIARECARTICAKQGPEGQWWWHYDVRTGAVLEKYPVYSVHQDSMAPMALYALKDVGGPGWSNAIKKGLDWLDSSREIDASLVDSEEEIIWRKVARREPRKFSRYAQAGISLIHSSLRIPLVEKVFPPKAVDFESRPYHLGWILYAWNPERLDRLEKEERKSLFEALPSNVVAFPRAIMKAAETVGRAFHLSNNKKTAAFPTVKALRPVAHGELPVSKTVGIPVHALRMPEVLTRVHSAVVQRNPLRIGVVNAAKIVKMRSSRALREDVLSSHLVLADGMSVVWASRILGCPLPERVAGIDLMMGMLKQGNEHGYRIYCLGATEEVSIKVVETIAKDFPRVHVTGRRNGYFTEAEEEQVAREIVAARPDILLVAMTSPKKEAFLAKWGDRLGVSVCHGVGGSFDVMAGKVKRAPRIWQRLGVEWLYRLLQEPRRLFSRYLKTNSRFCWMVACELLHIPEHGRHGEHERLSKEALSTSKRLASATR